MKPVSKHTKSKVVSGYIILLCLCVLPIYIVFDKITQFDDSEQGVSDANRKLYLISSTMTSLYEAEAMSSAFVQTGGREYMKQCQNIMKRVRSDVDTLKQFAETTTQRARIDSVAVLMEKKIRNLDEIDRVKRSIAPDEFYKKAIATIQSGTDTTLVQMFFNTRTIRRYDTSYLTTERNVKRWFSSKTEVDTTMKITVVEELVVDTILNPVAVNTHNRDSVLKTLTSIREDIKRKTRRVNSRIRARELALISQSALVTQQLRHTLSEYEREEIAASKENNLKRELTFDKARRTVIIVACIALGLILFFLFFILRDLTNSQRYRTELEKANAYADSLLESRQKMMLSVTHDIKSPLSSVLGYVALLSDTQINERQRHFLSNMKGSAEHILQLVTNLLDFSKLESNKMERADVAFNPYQLFEEICANYMPLAIQKKLRLEQRIGMQLNSEFMGDALRIRQVLSNILSNAVKYTERGTIRFTASYKMQTGMLVFSVRDTGPGMTEEEQEIIFKEFTRLKSGSSNEGSGLGLTITLKLINLLGGNLKLNSAKEKGSCFTVNLPLPHIRKPLVSKNESKERLEPKISVKDARVLVVDDDKLQIEMTEALLQRLGVSVETTLHSSQVPNILQRKKFDVVFTDIQMPEMDGFELVKRIREAKLTIPVIALSANAGKNADEYMDAGFTGYLAKPFTADKMIDILSCYLPKAELRNIPKESVPVKEASKSEVQEYTLRNIMQFADNDEELVKQFVASFLQDTDANCEKLSRALDVKDIALCGSVAHKMLPMFRQLEVQSVVPLLEQIERSLHETDIDVPPLVFEVLPKIKALVKLIKESY